MKPILKTSYDFSPLRTDVEFPQHVVLCIVTHGAPDTPCTAPSENRDFSLLKFVSAQRWCCCLLCAPDEEPGLPGHQDLRLKHPFTPRMPFSDFVKYLMKMSLKKS